MNVVYIYMYLYTKALACTYLCCTTRIEADLFQEPGASVSRSAIDKEGSPSSNMKRLVPTPFKCPTTTQLRYGKVQSAKYTLCGHIPIPADSAYFLVIKKEKA